MHDLRNRVAPIEVQRRSEFLTSLNSHREFALKFITDKGVEFKDNFQNLQVDEIFALGLLISDCVNIWQAYDILAEPMTNGICGYDAIFGPARWYTNRGLNKAMQKYTPRNMVKGLDIGVGTGTSTLVLAKRCTQIIGIDVLPSMLGIADAKLRKARANFILIEMDIRNVDLEPESFDIIIAEGAGSFAAQSEITQILIKIHDLLKRGGMFCQYTADIPREAIFGKSERGKLVLDIVNYVQYLTSVTSGNFWRENEQFDLSQIGFKQEVFLLNEPVIKGTFAKCTKI